MSQKTLSILAEIIIVILTFCLSGCTVDPNIPNGYIGEEEHFDKNGFQDYTDYCKYFYKDSSAFESNPNYHKVEDQDIPKIKEYFDDFKQSMEGDRAGEYDFDAKCMTSGDFVLIKSKEGVSDENKVYGKFDNYNVYYFDTDSNVLYLLHNNI